MKKHFWFPLVLIFAGAAVFFLFFRNNKNPYPKIIQNQSEEKPAIEQTGKKEIFDSISIPAFAKKNFDGHDFKIGNVLDKNTNYTRYFVSYKGAGLTISGIMNVPQGPGPFPVLFLNHGYIDPDIYTNGRGLKREQDYLARRGYIVIHSDYRNHAESDREADETVPDMRFGYAEDVVNGILALKKAALPYVAEEKIGMLGHSMGGGVAEIIAVARPDLVRAFALFAPVSADQKDNFEKWIKNDPEREAKNIERFGLPENNQELWKNASPINFFEQVNTPIIFQHGTADQDVPLEWSKRAVKALEAEGKTVQLYVYPGESHEFIDAWPQVMKRTLDFFDKYVK